jgi:hypothetical protein
MLDYLPFVAMLIPSLLLVTAAAISLSPKAGHASPAAAAAACATTS